jgi:hypothetical protein
VDRGELCRLRKLGEIYGLKSLRQPCEQMTKNRTPGPDDDFKDPDIYGDCDDFDDEFVEDSEEDDENYEEFLENEFGISDRQSDTSWSRWVLLAVLLAFSCPLLVGIWRIISSILYRP